MNDAFITNEFENVHNAIPDEDGRTQLQFRQGIMDGMKDERLESYENEIERYYRSLME